VGQAVEALGSAVVGALIGGGFLLWQIHGQQRRAQADQLSALHQERLRTLQSMAIRILALIESARDAAQQLDTTRRRAHEHPLDPAARSEMGHAQSSCTRASEALALATRVELPILGESLLTEAVTNAAEAAATFASADPAADFDWVIAKMQSAVSEFTSAIARERNAAEAKH
jgi:hypothetical protein